MRHYKECGLDNVYIIGGWYKAESPYGETISIPRTKELHKAIGLRIVSGDEELTPREIKFLSMEIELYTRASHKHMGLDASQLKNLYLSLIHGFNGKMAPKFHTTTPQLPIIFISEGCGWRLVRLN